MTQWTYQKERSFTSNDFIFFFEILFQFEIMQQIYRRTPIPKCDFQYSCFVTIEIALWHGCSPVHLMDIFRHFFIRTPLQGCFCILRQSVSKSKQFYKVSRKTRNHNKLYHCFRKICCFY